MHNAAIIRFFNGKFLPEPRGWRRRNPGVSLLYCFVLVSVCSVAALGGCSIKQMGVRASLPMMEDGMEAMNRESDLDLAREAMPANLKMLEGMTYSDPDNDALRIYAAQGFHGYTFAFVESGDPERAKGLYDRCREHAAAALKPDALRQGYESMPLDELQSRLAKSGQSDVPALFWTATCWAKWINLNLDDVESVSQLGRAAAMMERVLELDETYFYAGPNIFFGVYYGARSPMLGGDFTKSEQHFDRARELTGGKMLMVDVIEAQFLDRQRLDQDAFHNRLVSVIDAPDDLLPEATLINLIAKQQAASLLEQEQEWF
ncbi:MAG: TRAP transporter TatT component family protein [Pseudomonadota bacterium]|nr:TRAP transporter TatT component family protein [Pseudomonadota bacterium]